MKDDFANAFADFLDERLGKALFELREKNEDYCKLSGEYSVILSSRYQSVEAYGQAMERLSEISKTLTDIEKRYLFLAGMREHARTEGALMSDDFEALFVGLE